MNCMPVVWHNTHKLQLLSMTRNGPVFVHLHHPSSHKTVSRLTQATTLTSGKHWLMWMYV
jgi:hypothetical protein